MFRGKLTRMEEQAVAVFLDYIDVRSLSRFL